MKRIVTPSGRPSHLASRLIACCLLQMLSVQVVHKKKNLVCTDPLLVAYNYLILNARFPVSGYFLTSQVGGEGVT